MKLELPPLPPRGMRVEPTPRGPDIGRHRHASHPNRRPELVLVAVLAVAAIAVGLLMLTLSGSAKHVSSRRLPSVSATPTVGTPAASGTGTQTPVVTTPPVPPSVRPQPAVPKAKPPPTVVPTTAAPAPITHRPVVVALRPSATLKATGSKGHLLVSVRITGTLTHAVIVAYATTKHGTKKASMTRSIKGSVTVALRITVARGPVSVYATVTRLPTVLTTRIVHLEV